MKPRNRTIIVSEHDEAQLRSIADNYPLVSGHRLAQIVYRFGLRAMAHEPNRVLEEATTMAGNPPSPSQVAPSPPTLPAPICATSPIGPGRRSLPNDSPPPELVPTIALISADEALVEIGFHGDDATPVER